MADAPEAPAPAPADESVANQPTTNPEPAQAPDMHGFTSEQLADMKKFFDNNGGFDGVKAKISNPQPVEKTVEEKPTEPAQPTSPQPDSPQPTPPAKPQGITSDELMAQYYFETLSKKEEYAPIAKEIASGEVLKEMANLGIPFRYADGSWDKDRIGNYLELRAKTVPAQPTNAEPNMSSAPTVDYITVGDKIESLEQAQEVFMQKGHPRHQDAADYIKAVIAGKDPKASKK